MKSKLVFALVALAMALSCEAQNRWKAYVGGTISHLCETPIVSSDKSYGWGGGAFVGGGYEINFNSHWSLTPQLELAYINNGASLSSNEASFYQNHANWMSTWNINIPVLASYRFPVSDNLKLRIGVGPYIQEAIAGQQYQFDTDKKESMHGTFANRFNVGAMGEFALETGNHLSYAFRVNHPFLKEGWVRKTINLSLSVGYTF